MLLIVLTALILVWGAAALMVLAVCRNAARGDATRAPAPVAPAAPAAALRFIA